MNERVVTRRQALGCLAALAALPLPGSVACGRELDPARLVVLRRDRHSATQLGRAWLALQSPTPSAAALVARICAEHECASLDDDEQLHRVVTEQHRADFAEGRLVSLDGWLLTETEVALYALVAIAD